MLRSNSDLSQNPFLKENRKPSATRSRETTIDMDLQLRPERDTEAASPHTVLEHAERYERFEIIILSFLCFVFFVYKC